VLLRQDAPLRLDGPPVPGASGSAALRVALAAVEIAEEGLYWLTAGAAGATSVRLPLYIMLAPDAPR